MTFIINWLKYDDPLNGVSIFFGGGLTGSLSVGLFDHQEGVLYGSAGN
jgi:ammonia channel protein AmtB